MQEEYNNIKVRLTGTATQRAITLISLIITIIILLILAGLTINLTIGENGIFKIAKNAEEKYDEAFAREKLSVILANASTEKYINKLYNKEEYLTDFLENEGIVVDGNIVTVLGHRYLIDRDNLVILDYLGNILVTIFDEVQEYFPKDANGVYNARILLNIESSVKIKEIIVNNSDGTEKEKYYTDTKLSEYMNVQIGNTYDVIVKTIDDKVIIKTIYANFGISTVNEFVAFQRAVNQGETFKNQTIIIEKDIDLSSVCNSGINWTPIGNVTYPFEGILEGNNNKIEHIYISSEGDNLALFGCNKGVIQNLDVEGTIIGRGNNNALVVALNYGTIENVTTAGIVMGWRYVGGIAGQNINGTIKLCINNGEITYSVGAGGYYVRFSGGIAGALLGGTIEKCINKNEITGNHGMGGIVGSVEDGVIDSCINYATLKGIAEDTKSNGVYVGGIVGIHTKGTIRNCINMGNVNSSYSGSYCGGITSLSSLAEGLIENCYSKGNVSGGVKGGIVASIDYTKTKNNYWYESCGATYGKPNQKSNTGAEPKSDDELKQLQDTLGSAYTKDVKIDEKYVYNNGYPILKWQLENK